MFQLFHRTDEPSFVCAVPTGQTPPRFLALAWTFEGRAPEIESRQLAFDRPAAHARTGSTSTPGSEPADGTACPRSARSSP